MTLRVAVLADSHNRLPAGLPDLLAEADAVWHLGDVCDPRTLAPLQVPDRPLLIVRGNNDYDPSWPIQSRLLFGKVRFLLTHIAPIRVSDADVVLFGHTHVPCDETRNGIRWLNPGSIGLPNKGAPAGWAWLLIDEENGNFSWKQNPAPAAR